MQRLVFSIVLVALGFIAAPLRAEPPQPQGSPMNLESVTAALRTKNSDSRKGIITFERHEILKVRYGPFFSRDDDRWVGYVMQDGKIVGARTIAVRDGGKQWGQSQLNAENASWKKQLPRLYLTYSAPYLAGTPYTFEETNADRARCAECSPQAVSVAFESNVRDAWHGKGTMWLDPAHGYAPVKIFLTPYVMPKYSSGGEIETTFGEPLPGLIAPIHEESRYHGMAFLTPGTTVYTTDYVNYRRASSLDDAMTQLEKLTAPL